MPDVKSPLIVTTHQKIQNSNSFDIYKDKLTSPVQSDRRVVESWVDVGHLCQQVRIAGRDVLVHRKTPNFVD